MVDASSNEHQIIREIFKDYYAISTVRLLQLAHLEHQKKGLEGDGFLNFTKFNFDLADKTPEDAQNLYFSNIKDLNLQDIKSKSLNEWNFIKELLSPSNNMSNWCYAYMTPGSILSKNGSYKEVGALILSPDKQFALISNYNLFFHGGLGSPLPSSYFSPYSISKWQLVPTGYINSYTLQFQIEDPRHFTPKNISTIEPISPKTNWSSDVRLNHKSFFNVIADPVDVITGAFYVDEVDLFLPGAFPLEIGRNYNSQNPLISNIGCGWKLSLNPYLVEQDGKLLAAEPDGTVITYRYNSQTSRFEVFPEDNPDLCYFQNQSQCKFNPFQAYIKDNVLYSPDGSKRFFENGYLKKWINANGIFFTFLYKNANLSRIESSNGSFLGFHYNHENMISEIFAKDGKCISYEYNTSKDLVRVTLPNTAIIFYEYDRFHRLIRETKPCGKVIENIYDDQGRLKNQRSPMGPKEQIIVTATFEYLPGQTIVTDGCGGKTIYKIFQNQIYKIIDPLGFSTFQSWFIDEKSYFDPEKEKIVEWNQLGGFKKSLKCIIDKRNLTTYYLYDTKGNPIEISLKGDDLTGNKECNISKKFVYNDLNLCIQQEVLNQKTIITYDLTFPYLPKRIEKYSENNLISYIDFEYNSLGQITKEDICGSITYWKYDKYGFPYQKTQITNTEDPDVITNYVYNNQGKIIEVKTSDRTQKNCYDVMGNLIESKIFSLSNTLLCSSYIGYDPNCLPIWKQGANSNNIAYFDYHACGFIKATKQVSFPTQFVAYNLYEYDPRGFLIEETDPRGFTTYKDYDAIGNLTSITKEGITTYFTYEPGGLVETITTPSKAVITRHYTTNGLLKEEIYPDGTKNSFVYDFFGRLIFETKNDISWEIKYDDANHKVIRTHVKTKNTEISEFDAKGNLMRFIDSAGNITQNTYDALNRIKTKTTPNGLKTVCNYQDDLVICTLPNKEIIKNRYVASQIVESKVFDARGTLISSYSYHYDPENDLEKIINGEEITITSMNVLGLPIKVQKGTITSSYEYDACGNCISSIDGDSKVTYQKFDGLNRLIQKLLPDGSVIEYKYDLDSNLIEFHLPNGNVWQASYDSMKRKLLEELKSNENLTNHWDFIYENGYLKKSIDPVLRTHDYVYDSYGRLIQENVDIWHRIYTYDKRGFLTAAEQIKDNDISWLSSWIYDSNAKSSKIERSYDNDGNLILESIYLNSNLISQTHQKWTPNSRSLQIANHEQTFTYQNNQLVEVTAQNVNLSYTYDLSGHLKTKSNNFCSTTINYNSSSNFENIITNLPDVNFEENLKWNALGKLEYYLSPTQNQQFTYSDLGYLKSAGSEKYDFNFGKIGSLVCTEGPNWQVSQNGLDDFGKVKNYIDNGNLFKTQYDAMGQVISCNNKKFEWDPWGRLLKVTDPSFTWEASYDAFGRRLQTIYQESKKDPVITTSFYDPEEEFREIGVKIDNKIFWKIYGPTSCDAVIDESGEVVFLIQNALGQLVGVISNNKIIYNEELSSSYGYQSTSFDIPSDLISYAQSIYWHSKTQDPTGLIWMGKRYYDPKTGKFLSPDPISYPNCLDLYVYANGDPINYIDPDGRFASYAYNRNKPVAIDSFNTFVDCFRIPILEFTNTAVGYCSKQGWCASRPYEVGSFDLPNEAIMFINGIGNKFDQSREKSLKLCSNYGKGCKIYGEYNATHGKFLDIAECLFGYAGFESTPVEHLRKRWTDFFNAHGPDAKILQICHSGGSEPVYHALLESPKSIRDRILVLAINPSKIIPREICYRSFNYKSSRDFITRFDVAGNLLYGNQVHVIKAHPDAPFWDHDFLSPTFEDIIEKHITNFIKTYGEIK